AHRHERRRMGEGHAALPVEQDESSLAPAFLDEDVDGDLSRVGRIIHGLQDLDRPPRERDPDRGLAVAGAGDAGQRAVRVRAAADQGRVPDAPRGLAGAAARRGAGGDRAETIERDRSDRAGLERLELPPLAICHEVARITERDAERLRLLDGARADEEAVAASVQDPPRERDRVADVRHAGDGAIPEPVPFQDGGAHPDRARRREDGATARIEPRMILEHAHRGFDGGEGGAALEERLPARGDRALDALAKLAWSIGGIRAGAAVDDERGYPACHRASAARTMTPVIVDHGEAAGNAKF